MLLKLGRVDTAMAVFTCCHCYLRPGELVNLRCQDLGLPMAGLQTGLGLHTLTIAPVERGNPSKTQTFDDTVIVDSPPWLGEILELMSLERPPAVPLFQLTMPMLKRDWDDACRALGFNAHLYQLRHAGASTDTLSRRRRPEEIGDRGRWMTQRSRKRYAKAGAVQRVWRRLSLPVREWCTTQIQNIHQILLGRAEVPPLPVLHTVVNLMC